MSKVIVAYIPVLHQGYYQLFNENKDASVLYVLSSEIASQFTPVHKEIRALDEALIIKAIESWNIFDEVKIADESALTQINVQKAQVIIPDELVTTEVANKYLKDCTISISSIFLRWDKKSATLEVEPVVDATISAEKAAQLFMQLAVAEGEKSSDWWRRVGALAVRDGKVVKQTHNTHLPSEQQPYAEGDPRAHFHKGDHIELTTAIHAEAKLIAEAAASGLSLKDADLYLTDFPCPNCAKLIAHAEFKRVYFDKGYAMLDGERVLKTKGVQLIKVVS